MLLGQYRSPLKDLVAGDGLRGSQLMRDIYNITIPRSLDSPNSLLNCSAPYVSSLVRHSDPILCGHGSLDLSAKRLKHVPFFPQPVVARSRKSGCE